MDPGWGPSDTSRGPPGFGLMVLSAEGGPSRSSCPDRARSSLPAEKGEGVGCNDLVRSSARAHARRGDARGPHSTGDRIGGLDIQATGAPRLFEVGGTDRRGGLAADPTVETDRLPGRSAHELKSAAPPRGGRTVPIRACLRRGTLRRPRAGGRALRQGLTGCPRGDAGRRGW